MAEQHRDLLRQSGRRARSLPIPLGHAVVLRLVADQAFERADLAAQPVQRLGVATIYTSAATTRRIVEALSSPMVYP
ncbi:hypothetical protein [Mesorhizobium sp. SEMIA 3007]|uniref:hypothetical protein n=1 Tax=Mesorhizobium sp. SEMIA 3007 TaxID=1862350 RepID=UPI00114D00E3|nr:hypothetical protein [Mesorhizobium sp. SEMIA 3007]